MITNGYRLPSVAGSFYPSDPGKLISQIDAFFEKAPKFDIDGKIIGMIVPHAGYISSGFTAAIAYNLLFGKPIKNVVIISPSHHEFIRGVSLFDGMGYLTPLGRVDINKELSEELMASGNNTIYRSSDGHRGEHSIEVQIPFLQRVLSDFKIIPLVMIHDNFEISDSLSDILYKVFSNKDDFLIIATSDLSHYKSYDLAHKYDNIIRNDIEKFDPDSIIQNIMNGKTEACGCAPIVSMLKASKKLGASHSKVLHYSDSSTVFGDKSSVVGYLSAVIWKPV